MIPGIPTDIDPNWPRSAAEIVILILLVLKLYARNRVLQDIVGGIEEVKRINPKLRNEWENHEHALRASIGDKASKVVRKIKAKRKPVREAA